MSEKFAFIAAEKASKTHPPVTKMCVWLQVSTSGFYDHGNVVESARARRRVKVAQHVQVAFDLGRGSYGVRRVHRVLTGSHNPEVASCSAKLIRSVMAELGLKACQPRAYRTTTQPDPDATGQPADLLGRDFTADRPGGEAGRRHHLHPYLGRLAVSGHGDRLLQPRGDRLVDGRSYADQPGL